ncbi:hypothetical protein GON09_001303 [Rhodococcus sp. B50]|nr:hypothetical protein [Rhodococcus sp. B50]
MGACGGDPHLAHLSGIDTAAMAQRGPWWFSSNGGGRFDLSTRGDLLPRRRDLEPGDPVRSGCIAVFAGSGERTGTVREPTDFMVLGTENLLARQDLWDALEDEAADLSAEPWPGNDLRFVGFDVPDSRERPAAVMNAGCHPVVRLWRNADRNGGVAGSRSATANLVALPSNVGAGG